MLFENDYTPLSSSFFHSRRSKSDLKKSKTIGVALTIFNLSLTYAMACTLQNSFSFRVTKFFSITELYGRSGSFLGSNRL